MKTLLISLFFAAAPLAAGLPDLPQPVTLSGVDYVAGVLHTLDEKTYVSDAGLRKVDGYTALGTAFTSFSGVQDSRVPVPAGMDTDASGRLVLAQKDPCQIVVYAQDGSVVYTAGPKPASTAGADPATCNFVDQPADVSVGPDGRLYVADTGHNRIAVFSGDDGHYLGAWGTLGYDGTDHFYMPMGVAVSGGKVYVADAGNARIMIYDLDGHFISQLGARGIDAAGFDSPFDVAVDGAGRIWVADNGLQKIVVFDSAGNFLKAYGLPGDAVTFEDLTSLYAGEDGEVVAGDGYTGRLFSFATGVTYTRVFNPKEAVPGLDQAQLAFGPVPSKQGQPLALRLPFAAQRVAWELLSLDQRQLATGEVQHADRVSLGETASLGTGVYLLHTTVEQGGGSRQVLQKIVVVR